MTLLATQIATGPDEELQQPKLLLLVVYHQVLPLDCMLQTSTNSLNGSFNAYGI